MAPPVFPVWPHCHWTDATWIILWTDHWRKFCMHALSMIKYLHCTWDWIDELSLCLPNLVNYPISKDQWLKLPTSSFECLSHDMGGMTYLTSSRQQAQSWAATDRKQKNEWGASGDIDIDSRHCCELANAMCPLEKAGLDLSKVRVFLHEARDVHFSLPCVFTSHLSFHFWKSEMTFLNWLSRTMLKMTIFIL